MPHRWELKRFYVDIFVGIFCQKLLEKNNAELTLCYGNFPQAENSVSDTFKSFQKKGICVAIKVYLFRTPCPATRQRLAGTANRLARFRGSGTG